MPSLQGTSTVFSCPLFLPFGLQLVVKLIMSILSGRPKSFHTRKIQFFDRYHYWLFIFDKTDQSSHSFFEVFFGPASLYFSWTEFFRFKTTFKVMS
jgi:hypothetical protein